MTQSIFQKAKISGISSTIPKNFRLLDDEIDTLYNGNQKKIDRIKKTIGLNKRHIAEDNVTTADLCENSARLLIEKTGINKDEIDCLILVTQTPDYLQPATANYLHGKLGFSESTIAFDVNQGCSGYVYGLWLASSLIESNSCNKILLLAGDTLSKIVDPTDSNVAPLFGDAGTATLIEKSNLPQDSYYILKANGSKFDTIIHRNSAFRKDALNTSTLYMDGGAVFNFAIEEEPKAIKEILEFSKNDVESVDYFVFHQANKYIIENISKRAKLDLNKVPRKTTGEFGNQSSASIPVTICNEVSNFNSNLKCIFSGFGVGLSWGTCLLSLDKITVPQIEYI